MILRFTLALIVTVIVVFNIALIGTYVERKIMLNQLLLSFATELTIFYVGYWIITGRLLWR